MRTEDACCLGCNEAILRKYHWFSATRIRIPCGKDKKNGIETLLTSQNEPNPLFKITHFPPLCYDRTTPRHLFFRSQISISFARFTISFSGMHKSKKRISKRIIFFSLPITHSIAVISILLLVPLFSHKFIRIQCRIYMCVDEIWVGMKSVTLYELEI